ncbi:MAG: hypothetical protein Q9181_004282 [Wetmoreana brouardii]
MSAGPCVTLSLTTSANLSFDLWKGFIGEVNVNVNVNVRFAHTAFNNENRPLHIEYAAAGFNHGWVSPTWAFTKGLLSIKDELGDTIRIRNEALIDITPH